jgi:hypothetical protein
MLFLTEKFDDTLSARLENESANWYQVMEGKLKFKYTYP